MTSIAGAPLSRRRPRESARASTHLGAARECVTGDEQSGATAFPPPLWGRDRESGTAAPLLVSTIQQVRLHAATHHSRVGEAASCSARRGHPSPCPSPTRGEGTVWLAPSHLT